MADKPNNDQTKTDQQAVAAKDEAKDEAKVAEAEAKTAPAKEKPKAAKETKDEAQAAKAKPISAELKKLAEQLVNLNVLAVNQLGDYLKSKYGIEPAAAAVVASGAGASPAGGGAGGEAAAAEAKSEYTVTLKDAGSQKIAVIKAVKDLTGLGLGESKAIVDEAPKAVKEKVAKDEAEEMKAKLEEAGATVELS